MKNQIDYQTAQKIIAAAIQTDDGLRIAFESNIAMAFLDNMAWYKQSTGKKTLNRSDFHTIANAAAQYFIANWIINETVPADAGVSAVARETSDAGVSTAARSIADFRSTRPRKKGAGRRPSIDAAGVKRAEQMLFEGKEISDIAHQLHCSERTIRRVLNREHKFSNQPEA